MSNFSVKIIIYPFEGKRFFIDFSENYLTFLVRHIMVVLNNDQKRNFYSHSNVICLCNSLEFHGNIFPICPI